MEAATASATLSREELEGLAEPLPEEFTSSNVRRHLLILGAIVAVVAAVVLLLPGLGEVRESFAGAQPGWLALAALLQVGSCVSYVLAFRAVFCRRMQWRT